MLHTTDIATQPVWTILENVMDPEVPVLSVLDLGIVRHVSVNGNEVEVVITPTYTGCPAMDTIKASIQMELLAAGYSPVSVKQVLSPAWTTDWMSEEGKRKLKEYGIAPPNPKQQVCHQHLFVVDDAVQCPAASANSAALPAKRFINVMTAKNLSIILNAINPTACLQSFLKSVIIQQPLRSTGLIN